MVALTAAAACEFPQCTVKEATKSDLDVAAPKNISAQTLDEQNKNFILHKVNTRE